jgi:hypothetical protein
MQHLRTVTAKVLGLASFEDVDPAAGLMDLGMGSLMAIELRNQLSRTLVVSLPATLAFDYPSLVALHLYLLHELEPPSAMNPQADLVPLSNAVASSPNDLDDIAAQLAAVLYGENKG